MNNLFVLLLPFLLLPLFLVAALSFLLVPFLLLWLFQSVFPTSHIRRHAADDEEVLNQDLEELADDWMDHHSLRP